MKLLYSLGIRIYGGLLSLAALFNDKARLLRKGQKNAFALLKKKKLEGEEYTWFHAASLGEFEQARPLIETLKKTSPQTKILLTFFSPSGYEIRKNYDKADIVLYLPLDTRQNARKLLNTVRIKQAIFVKYEFWPNYLQALFRAKISVYGISAIFRPSQLFFKSYGKCYLNLLKNFTHIFVQDEASEKLLAAHDVKNVSIGGDTRFDRVKEIREQAKTLPLIEKFAEKSKVLVAGSTWQPDEDLLIKYSDEHPDVKLILVPHEIGKAHLENIFKSLKNDCITYSEMREENIEKSKRLLIDAIGFLSSVYQYADVAYIGGGFGVGIHNTLEAAVYGIPLVFGPNYQKFREARELIQENAAFAVDDYQSLKKQLDYLFQNNEDAGAKAGKYVEKNTGATETILKKINFL